MIPKEYEEFSTLFDEEATEEALPSHQPWDHTIPIKEGMEPSKSPIYPLSAEKLNALREYLDENLKKGFIRESQSPAGYPILFVPKKDGKLRLCVDYRGLNNVTIKNSYPLPLISELQDRLQGAKWFTKFDIPGTYNRIRMKEGEEWKTAMRTRFGLYEYTVMPFGLTNAPATFQAYINNVLRKYLDVFVVVYLDDILVYSTDERKHVEHVRKVLQALKDADLRVKPEKSEFHKQEIEFLGYIVSEKGLKMDPSKVKSILEWPKPQSVKDIQSFLGLANFYRKFVRDYSRIAQHLTDATRKDVPFKWNALMQGAFDELKHRFSTEPVLIMFDPGKEILMERDSSDLAMGACLNQKDDKGKWHPVAFHSRKFSAPEQNYEIHDKELLAIVEGFKQWKVYCEGSKYPAQVYTDHKNLVYFTTTKVLNRRQVRWSEELSSYNFEIHYRKGSENTKADALSRRPDYMEERPEVKQSVLQQTEKGTLKYNHQVAATMTIRNDDLETRIKVAYAKDKQAQRILEGEQQGCTISGNGLILFQGLVYVPSQIKEEVIKGHHDGPTSGHPGVSKTIEAITRTYHFPHVRKKVQEYIAKCDLCHKIKPKRHQPYGLLKSPETPSRPWSSIALDFIVKLPLSEEPMTRVKYDSILTIVDRLTKEVRFIPYMESSNTTDLVYTFLRHVVSTQSLPNEIISDRDKLFASKFWQALTKQLGLNHKLSTGYHPQTDGQTERMNQVVEQYIRAYVSYRQDDWVKLLPVAQLAYNNSINETTGQTPFYANHGYHAELFRDPRPAEEVTEAANLSIEELRNLQKDLKRDIEFLNLKSAFYANKHRSRGPMLKEGDKVYLLRKNIETTRPSKKLDHVRIGPFRIIRNIKGVSFELKLPKGMKIHPVFHISLLELAPDEVPELTQVPDNYLMEQEQRWEVERVLDKSSDFDDNTTRYLVKWKEHSDNENTWEPVTNLDGCEELIEQYRQRVLAPEKRKATSRKQRSRPRKN